MSRMASQRGRQFGEVQFTPLRHAEAGAKHTVMSLSRGSIISMSETPDVDNLGAVLWLECHRHHPVGRLLMNRPQRQIEYRRAGQIGPPDSWPLNRDDFYSEPACPGGCPYEVGAPADLLVRRVVNLANDSNAEEDTFELSDVGPAQSVASDG